MQNFIASGRTTLLSSDSIDSNYDYIKNARSYYSYSGKYNMVIYNGKIIVRKPDFTLIMSFDQTGKHENHCFLEFDENDYLVYNDDKSYVIDLKNKKFINNENKLWKSIKISPNNKLITLHEISDNNDDQIVVYKFDDHGNMKLIGEIEMYAATYFKWNNDDILLVIYSDSQTYFKKFDDISDLVYNLDELKKSDILEKVKKQYDDDVVRYISNSMSDIEKRKHDILGRKLRRFEFENEIDEFIEDNPSIKNIRRKQGAIEFTIHIDV